MKTGGEKWNKWGVIDKIQEKIQFLYGLRWISFKNQSNWEGWTSMNRVLAWWHFWMQIANWVECCKGHETWTNQDTGFFSNHHALGIVGKSSFKAFWEIFSGRNWMKIERDMRKESWNQKKTPKNTNSLWPRVPMAGNWIILNGTYIPFIRSVTAGVWSGIANCKGEKVEISIRWRDTFVNL